MFILDNKGKFVTFLDKYLSEEKEEKQLSATSSQTETALRFLVAITNPEAYSHLAARVEVGWSISYTVYALEGKKKREMKEV